MQYSIAPEEPDVRIPHTECREALIGQGDRSSYALSGYMDAVWVSQ